MTTAITSDAELEALLRAPGPVWLFKHSATCGVSAAAHDEVAAYLSSRPGDTLGMVVVQTHRPLSNAIATRLAHAHQSPQLFLLAGGKVLWHASHWGITAAAMSAARKAASTP